ncbi:Similar to Hsd17b13: 17-beta-hydroxysteroid dehydrogenase 13 (Mus musculus) [Cotesia congregata]|uniref:Similar to Hsd17b13: 17-beta-hydroxysteroid dehydrogenase 13 (Mus musculus) n=1 Tax=Cotesia congregata TaxID=51543 RepID=A0A8J2MQQ2_COTCN|nr:Similar to Hsd17b13: 17-beta-hydroxysteroid dehydrogenase 13 (Mus musculus) [Cotesia congregata]
MQMENMLLKVYSLMVLMLDLLTLLFGIIISIIVAFYRTLRPPAMKSLHGEVAVVIGAGRGVGREIAFQLCLLGVKVACIDKNDKMCKATVQQASRDSAVIKPYICDITDKKQLLESILPGMQRLGRGHIVALSSVAGFSGAASRSARVPFSTAQFAIQGFTESLQAELRQSNSNIIITLVHIYPFIIDSETANDIRLRIPSYFGTMPASEAARKILDGVRRNYAEFSIPGYLLYLGHVLRYQ